ncbi:MAG TPA: hypothetical protein VEA78_11400 [Acidimicrobiales bacterium]|nr:hypothetical protein [Acidimicrobiales bacterium]
MSKALTEATEKNGHITRDDIESKLRQITGEVSEVGSASKSYVLIAGAVAAVGLLAGAYVLGRRKGKKRTTVVEVRRL